MKIIPSLKKKREFRNFILLIEEFENKTRFGAQLAWRFAELNERSLRHIYERKREKEHSFIIARNNERFLITRVKNNLSRVHIGFCALSCTYLHTHTHTRAYAYGRK